VDLEKVTLAEEIQRLERVQLGAACEAVVKRPSGLNSEERVGWLGFIVEALIVAR